jgi:hypothetical protein
MLQRIEGRAMPPRGERIAQTYIFIREAFRPEPALRRFGFFNDSGELALKIELRGEPQAAAFVEAIGAAGFRLIDPPEPGYDYFFEPVR